MENFGEWLKSELEKRKISQKELADLSGITPAQISRIISGTRGAGEQALVAIARALRIPPELVFQKAGLLPITHSELSSKKRELLANLENADDNTVQFVIDMLEVAVKNKQRQVPSGTEIKTNPRLL
jgi:transcriptional regulator with XRE-family HTH domain